MKEKEKKKENIDKSKLVNFSIIEGYEKKGGLNLEIPPKPSTPPPGQKPSDKSK